MGVVNAADEWCSAVLGPRNQRCILLSHYRLCETETELELALENLSFSGMVRFRGPGACRRRSHQRMRESDGYRA